MSTVLGISAYYHDAAAALVRDSQLVCAIQEERLSRIKNDASLPFRAARACLRFANIKAPEIDAVVYYESPFLRIERVLLSLLRSFPFSMRQFPRALGSQLGKKLWVLDDIASMLDIPRECVIFSEHHQSHAASAFYCSPWKSAAVLTVDGVGEDISTAIWQGNESGLNCIESISYPHSLGLFYAALTAYLGFEVNEGEYKVMGLAAFGKPRFQDEFSKILKVCADGSFELDLSYFAYASDTELGFSRKLEALLGPRRLYGKAWQLDQNEDDRRFADIAASLQARTEEALLGLARRARERTGEDFLCMAGGVALNAVANARIARQSGFKDVFVHPAAGDAGGALGAAIWGAMQRGDKRPLPLESAALGLCVDAGAAMELAGLLGLRSKRVDDPALFAARQIEKGSIFAHCAGRFEWGPRALGPRSILADPSDVNVRERLNRAIKKREPFRPFAPAVLAEKSVEWFEGPPDSMTPFMTTVRPVLEHAREKLGAVTHVDGTARVQTVTNLSSPALYSILKHLDSIRGLPIVLNTSQNGAGEPIVAEAKDAIAFFMAHGTDGMLIEDVWIQKPDEFKKGGLDF